MFQALSCHSILLTAKNGNGNTKVAKTMQERQVLEWSKDLQQFFRNSVAKSVLPESVKIELDKKRQADRVHL
jgi:hypothetical protein